MRTLVVFVFALCTFAALVSASQSVHVKMHVFAGTRDPEWRLQLEEATEFLSLFGNELVDSDLYSGRMGYTGFSVTVYNRNFRVRTKHVYGQQDAELFLLNSAAKHHVVAEHVLEHAKSEIAAFSTRPATSFIQKPSHHRFALNKCTAPVVGPDNETDYAPQTDNCGFYETYQVFCPVLVDSVSRTILCSLTIIAMTMALILRPIHLRSPVVAVVTNGQPTHAMPLALYALYYLWFEFVSVTVFM